MENLTQLQKQLCTRLQQGLPVCERPFDNIADELGENVENLLEQIRQLKNEGFIRRFRPIINHRALGKSGTLVTAHVPEERLQEVGERINALSGVSHNYLREHFYNLWFTLQAQSDSEIEHILKDLHECFSIEFHHLPVVRTFKLNVRFDITDNKKDTQNKAVSKPKDETVVLNEDEKNILSKLQNELEITETPFSFLSSENFPIEDVLKIIRRLIERGVIRRIAAVIDYRQVGFTANALFACEVPQEKIIEAGEKLAASELVSHCYERKTFEGWPYNLFAMMHSKSMEEIQKQVRDFIESEKIKSHALLPTITELKKEPVQHKFQ